MDKALRVRRAGPTYKRPNFPLDFKRRLVEQSYEPGASAARVARANDINANLLFKWRRQYLAGAYGTLALPGHTTPTAEAQLMPVTVMEEVRASMPDEPAREAAPIFDGHCDIEFEHARLRIRGDVSPAILTLLIRELSR
ncbi:IS66-like element accessory protein TnpA [Pandoraea cepalis]|uniref:IS66-like element accessory protein TnpA n=1 Tax=Pandoraea cepalis TaxID=2508294 RepID=UPI00263B85E1|nr:transposase [Pandoraea cepalis]